MKIANRDTDVNEYFSEEILQWCCTKLQNMGFDSENSLSISNEDWLFSHHTVYVQLQMRIFSHVWQQLESVLAFFKKSHEAFNWWSSSVDESIWKINLINDELKKWFV